MIAILRHELSSYFHSFTAYVFGAFLLVAVGIGAMLFNIQAAVANFEYVLSFVNMILVVIVPILTMRVIAEEKKQKTDQLLYSLPISYIEIVCGKYLALLIVFLIPLVIICFYPLIFAQFGDVYLPTSYGSIFAFFVMGAALLSLGMFISSLTENQGFAAGIGVAVILLNYFSVSLSEYISSTAIGTLVTLWVLIILLGLLIRHLLNNESIAFGVTFVLITLTCIIYFINSSLFEGLLVNIMTQISLFERFNTFVNGVFDFTSIFFYISFIIFFLFLTVQSLEKRRYNS